MPITNTDLKRLSNELTRLPRQRKTYSKKAALHNLTDQMIVLLRQGRSIESIYWKLERALGISEKDVKTALLNALQAEFPAEAPETVLAKIISEGQPAVDTTATPRAIEQSQPAVDALPAQTQTSPPQAQLAQPDQANYGQQPQTTWTTAANGTPCHTPQPVQTQTNGYQVQEA